MIIQGFKLGQGAVFVIAEIGNNHNGSVEKAKQLVDVAVSAGADCVKFQIRNMSHVYRESSLKKTGDDLGTEYVLDLLEKFQLSAAEHELLRKYCDDAGIRYICTPWDITSVELLEQFEVPAYKIASADLTNWPLINRVVETGKPIILSTGMSAENEVAEIAFRLKEKKSDFALLHCNSTYPAPFSDINLRWMQKLKKHSDITGYSGHERGSAVSLGAVALGAQIIERHLTLDRNMEGPDHAASLEPDEFIDLVKGVREIEVALGDGNERRVSQGEMINRENLSKSLVASRALNKGHILSEADFLVRSPGMGVSPLRLQEFLGKPLVRKKCKEDYFFESDISLAVYRPRRYSFSRPWGIPVRYHDFSDYNKLVSPSIFEFHLSYSDMMLDISKYLDGQYDCDFAVHAPELFSESRLMDLTSEDEAYRQFSIDQTQAVIDIARELKSYFPKTQCPLIIANVGGFSMDEPIPVAERGRLYDIFAESLEKLDTSGVELIPQTMAPFPWHFGGQRYQNLFVDADEIVAWCRTLSLRMCLDVSHSKLACNYFGWDFENFIEKVSPLSGHLHLGDASGVNGEGLQIGAGEIDFSALLEKLNALCPDASFIPEIWQGHKNGGEGFWIALEKMERMSL